VLRERKRGRHRRQDEARGHLVIGGICCSVTMIYNTLLNNIGYGIISDSGGYMGNVMAQNSSGSVHGASRSMGQNLCNGTVC
jgi:hypothetical protein